jgi:uncharacterized membrane protein YfcA
MHVLGYALALLIGLSLGLLGGGGSILTVPIFVYVLGFEAKQAIAMSLPVVGVTSLVGALGHWRAGNVDLRRAALFGVIAMVGSFAGARLAGFLSGATQLVLLAIAMLAAAISMARPRRTDRPADPAPGSRADGRLALLVPVGLAVGLLTGVVGIGGGFLIVPALVVLGGVPMKQAVGTSLLVIAMNTVSGYLGYRGQVVIPWDAVAAFTVIAAVGIIIGTTLVRYVSQVALRRAFAAFLVVVGGLILYQNRGRWTRDALAGSAAPADRPHRP